VFPDDLTTSISAANNPLHANEILGKADPECSDAAILMAASIRLHESTAVIYMRSAGVHLGES